MSKHQNGDNGEGTLYREQLELIKFKMFPVKKTS